jgi:hypothetical protein
MTRSKRVGREAVRDWRRLPYCCAVWTARLLETVCNFLVVETLAVVE